MARSAANVGQELLRGIQSADAKLAELGRRSTRSRISDDERILRERERREAAYWSGVERFNRRMLSARLAGEREYARERERLDRAAAKAAEERQRRLTAGAASAIRGASALSSRVGSAVASGGAGLGGVIAGIGGGGLSGLVSSAGSVAGLGIQTASRIGGAVVEKVPLVGGLLSGGLQAAGGIASGVAQLGANVGAQIVDSALGAVKVGLAAGLGATIAAVARASSYEQLRGAFEGITRGAGEDATNALQRLRIATRGTVDEITLLRQANLAFQLGAVSSTEEFGLLAESAIKLGRAVGRDASEALSDITIGLGRASPRILDNLGIIVQAEEAYYGYASAVGKSVTDLTAAERRTAFQNAALQALRRTTASLSDSTDSFSERWDRLSASFLDLLTKAGRPLLGVLGEIVDQLDAATDGIADFLDENRVEIADSIGKALKGAVDGLRGAVEYLDERGLAGVLDDVESAAKRLWKTFTTEARASLATVRGEAEIFLAEFEGSFRTAMAELPFFRLLPDIGTPESERERADRAVSAAATNAWREAKAIRDVAAGLNTSIQGAGTRIPRPTFDFAREVTMFSAPSRATRDWASGTSAAAPTGRKDDPLYVLGATVTPQGAGREAGGAGASYGGGRPGFLVQVEQEIRKGIRIAQVVGGKFGVEFPDFFPDPSPPQTRGGNGRASADRTLALAGLGTALMNASTRAFPDRAALGEVFSTEALSKLDADEIRAATKRVHAREQEAALAEEATRLTRHAVEGLTEIASLMTMTERNLKSASDELRDIESERLRTARLITKIGDEIYETNLEAVRKEKELTEGIVAEYKRAVEQLQQQFRGALAGASNDSALPRNLRLGFARSDRAIEREVERRLADEFRGVSAGDIGRDPFLRARAEAAVVSTRNDVMRPLEGARDIAAMMRFNADFGPERAVLLEQSNAELAAALERLRAENEATVGALEASKEAAISASEESLKTFVAVRESHKVLAERLVSLEAEARKTREEIDRVKSLLSVRGK